MTILRASDPALAPTHPAPEPAPAPPVQVASPPTPSAFARILAGLGREVDAGETLVRRTEGRPPSTMDAAELIALQVGVCRYAEAVDLAARLVDHASTAVKTVVEGQ